MIEAEARDIIATALADNGAAFPYHYRADVPVEILADQIAHRLAMNGAFEKKDDEFWSSL